MTTLETLIITMTLPTRPVRTVRRTPTHRRDSEQTVRDVLRRRHALVTGTARTPTHRGQPDGR